MKVTPVLLFITCLYSCRNYEDFPKVNHQDYVIEECFTKVVEGRFIVTNEAELEMVMPDFRLDSLLFPACDSVPLPHINFQEVTLVGYRKCGSGCETNFNRIVYHDEKNKKYIYEVEVEEIGACLPLRCEMNWILLPRLPDDYFIEFI